MRAAPYQALRLRPRAWLAHGAAPSQGAAGKRLAGAEIDLAHLGVVADRGGVAVGDQPAARQHDDAVGEGEHHVHRMLGEQHRDLALDHQPLDQCDELVALARAHAGGRLVHQQQARLVGERDGEFDALDVAIGELAARPVGGLAHADLREQIERARRGAARRPDATAGKFRRRARSAPSARSRRPSSSRRWRRPGRCGRRRAARCRAAPSPAMFLPSNRISPESGASWPLIMLKQVVLPAPFGPIMARNSPGATAKLTSLTARTPPKALDSERTSSTLMTCAPLLRQSAAKPPTMPLRERQHQQQDDGAQQRAPIFGLPHHRVLQGGEHRGADDRPGQRLDAAEQHHHQAVDGAADVDGLRRDRALGEGEQPAGHAADRAGNGEAEPMHALDVDADGFGAQRANRAPPAWHSRTARTESAAAAARRSPPAPASAGNRPMTCRTAAAATRRSRRWSRRSAPPIGTPSPRRSARRPMSAWRDRRRRAAPRTSRTAARRRARPAARRRARGPWARPAISPAAPRHRRRARNRRRGRTNACRPARR